MPWRPIFQLVDHRAHCLGQDPRRIQAELGSRLPLPPVAWRELLAMRRPVTRPQPRAAAGIP
jgi:hypothetical protein